jgi:hypothetical protein
VRRMSFMLTAPQMRARTKTVTRRTGWAWLQPGTLLLAVVQARGLPKGAPVRELGVIRVRSVRSERLDALLAPGRARWARGEVVAEGFPELTPAAFVAMFCATHRCAPDDVVTRIEFEHVAAQRERRALTGTRRASRR